ncbi:hypothetical protein K4T56_06395 [Staphylococcus epidermidis]|nr:hypothetical protein [Staphylococcus epidermidis]
MVKVNHGRYKHGYSDSKLYRTWCNMKSRCNNERSKDYSRYGGRGIKVCEEWSNDFVAFHNWAINNGYKENLTIDRIDVNGYYEPNNCRWVSMKEQSVNKENTLTIAFKGKEKHISELSEELNIPASTIWYRYKNNIPIDLDKSIEQLDGRGNIIGCYKNIEQAIKETGFTSIRKVFQGKCKTAGGYKWRNAKQN